MVREREREEEEGGEREDEEEGGRERGLNVLSSHSRLTPAPPVLALT